MSIEDTLYRGLPHAAVPSSVDGADTETIIGLAVTLGRLQREAQSLGCEETAFLLSLAVGTLEEYLPKVTN